jgi:hypothetical protein
MMQLEALVRSALALRQTLIEQISPFNRVYCAALPIFAIAVKGRVWITS